MDQLQQLYFQLGGSILNGQKLSAIDVGGAGGLLGHWRPLLGNTRFYMYEPREDSCRELEQIYSTSPFKQDFRFIPSGLSGEGGLRKLYVTNSPSSSSLLEPNVEDPRFKNNPTLYPYSEQLIRTQTLKDSLNEEGAGTIDAIKLDCQGAELEILKSFDSARLKSLLMVEVELGLSECYKGVPTIGEMFDFMKSNDMEIYDIRTQRGARCLQGTNDSYPSKLFNVADTSPSIASKVYELDLVFFKTPQLISSQAQARRLILLQCTYNFFAEAAHTVLESSIKSMFTEEERSLLLEAIKYWQQINAQLTSSYEKLLGATNNQVWGQYTWVPYPNS